MGLVADLANILLASILLIIFSPFYLGYQAIMHLVKGNAFAVMVTVDERSAEVLQFAVKHGLIAKGTDLLLVHVTDKSSLTTRTSDLKVALTDPSLNFLQDLVKVLAEHGIKPKVVVCPVPPVPGPDTQSTTLVRRDRILGQLRPIISDHHPELIICGSQRGRPEPGPVAFGLLCEPDLVPLLVVKH